MPQSDGRRARGLNREFTIDSFHISGWRVELRGIQGAGQISSEVACCRINAAFRQVSERCIYAAAKNFAVRPGIHFSFALLPRETLSFILSPKLCGFHLRPSELAN